MKWWQLVWFSCLRRIGDPKKIQPKGRLKARPKQKGCAKVLQSYFFLDPACACVKKSRPAAKKVRAIEITIAVLPHRNVLSRARRSASSKQHLYPARPHAEGTKALEKGGLACAAISTSCLLLSLCSPH
jgi:hypothetical protein